MLTRLLVGAVAALLVVAPASRADTRVLAKVDGSADVDAFRGVVAWTATDDARKRHWLMVRQRGVTSRLRVASSLRPFEIDLGPDGAGGVALVYSRCDRGRAVEPSGCDLHRYLLSRGRDERLEIPGSRVNEERTPSIWGRRVAYTQTRTEPQTVVDAVPRVRVLTLGRAQPARFAPGPRGVVDDLGRQEFIGAPRADLELVGQRLAVVWQYVPKPLDSAARVWVDDLVGRTRQLIAPQAGERVAQAGRPSLDGRSLAFWAVVGPPAAAFRQEYRSVDVATGAVTRAAPAVALLRSQSQDGAATVGVDAGPDGFSDDAKLVRISPAFPSRPAPASSLPGG